MSIRDPSIQAFLDYLQHERQFSLHTVTSYKTDLLDAFHFFSTQNITNWENVEESTVRSLLSFKRNQGIEARSLNRQLSALKTFYRFLTQKKLIHTNKISKVATLKTSKPLPKAIDVDQMAKLLEFPSSNPMAIRDIAIMELLYSSGLRISEMVSLNLEDIDLKQQQTAVMGKGKKTRLALIGKFAVQAIQNWLKIRVALAKPTETALFVNKNGSRLSARGIQYRLYNIGIQQGLGSRVTPHRFRHSFASHLLESSNDLRSVQELLGHTDLSTTEIYTKVNFQHLANIYDQCHPRARKLKKEHEE